MNHAEEGCACSAASELEWLHEGAHVCLMGHSGILPMSLSLVICVVQAQAEQHANELLNQWSSAKRALLAASA